jgi:hypothetical protein
MKKKKTANEVEDKETYDQFIGRMKELHPLNESGRPAPPAKPRFRLVAALPEESDEEPLDEVIDTLMSDYDYNVSNGYIDQADVPTKEGIRKRFVGQNRYKILNEISRHLSELADKPIVSAVQLERMVNTMMSQFEEQVKYGHLDANDTLTREELRKRYVGKSPRQICAENRETIATLEEANRKRILRANLAGDYERDKEYFLFVSYAQLDTAPEATIFFRAARAKFPEHKIFRDRDTHFKLNDLVRHVSSAKNVIVLLSSNYPKRPFTLIELNHALASGAHVCPVIVRRQGVKPFDFDQVRKDIKAGKVAGYLDDHGWDLLYDNGVTLEDVEKDLQEVMNVAAPEFSVDHPDIVQDAMIESVLQRLSC